MHAAQGDIFGRQSAPFRSARFEPPLVTGSTIGEVVGERPSEQGEPFFQLSFELEQLLNSAEGMDVNALVAGHDEIGAVIPIPPAQLDLMLPAREGPGSSAWLLIGTTADNG